jgi:hypothetical protein
MKVRDGGSIVVLVVLAVIFIGAIFTQEKAKTTAEYSGETTTRAAEVTDAVEAAPTSGGNDDRLTAKMDSG